MNARTFRDAWVRGNAVRYISYDQDNGLTMSVEKLGQHISNHSTSVDYFVIATITLLLALFSATLSVIGFFQREYVAMLVAVIISCIFGAIWWRQEKKEIDIYEKGLSYRSRSRVSVLAWRDIDEVYQQSVKYRIYFMPAGSEHTFKIVARAHRFVVDRNVSKSLELGNYIRDKVFESKLPDIYSRHAAGEVLTFGILALQRTRGIWYRNSLLSWQDVKSVDVHAGYIEIRKYGSILCWRKVAVSTIPNALLFIVATKFPQAFTVT